MLLRLTHEGEEDTLHEDQIQCYNWTRTTWIERLDCYNMLGSDDRTTQLTSQRNQKEATITHDF